MGRQLLPVRHRSPGCIIEEIDSKLSQIGHSPLIKLDGFVLKIISIRLAKSGLTSDIFLKTSLNDKEESETDLDHFLTLFT